METVRFFFQQSIYHHSFFLIFTMPKVSPCTFSKCAIGLNSSTRENFTVEEELHWKACHVNEPVKFTCPYTGQDVQLERNPQLRYYFICVCGKSKILNSGSVRRQVLPARTVQEASEPSSDSPQPSTSDVENLAREPSPSASSVSGVVPYSDGMFILLNVYDKTMSIKKKKKTLIVLTKYVF